MIYMRGNRADYDGWAAMGLAGWGYEDVLPYFRRAEDNERGESSWHGVGGPLSVSDSRSMQPVVGACIEAAVQAGVAPTRRHDRYVRDGEGSVGHPAPGRQRSATAGARSSPSHPG